MIPEYLSVSDPHSFAHFTVKNRFPEILYSVIDNNNFDTETKNKLLELLNTSYKDKPFILIENDFYHKICEITNYKKNKIDFFAYKKNTDAITKINYFKTVLEQFKNIFDMPPEQSLATVLKMNLHGNTADLSHIHSLGKSKLKLLMDHTKKISASFLKAQKIHFVLDNSGEELFLDLLLAYLLFQKTKVIQIVLHFKDMPIFVSDALISDYNFLINLLKQNECGEFVNNLKKMEQNGSLILSADPLWAKCTSFKEDQEEIRKILSGADLVIFKGDLNYRKLVEDRDWKYTTPTENLVDYLNTDCILIRVLKSEIITGLNPENIPDIENKKWMFDATCGVLEFIEK